MRDPEGARFLFRMAKAARKHWAGPGRGHPGRRGRPGRRPGPRRRSPTPPPRSCSASPPRPSTKSPPSSACPPGNAPAPVRGPGNGLLACGPSARVAFQALASPDEQLLCTSDPAEIARLNARQPGLAQPACPAAARRQRRMRTGCRDPRHRACWSRRAARRGGPAGPVPDRPGRGHRPARPRAAARRPPRRARRPGRCWPPPPPR